jgi:hypothetical protein
MAGGLGVQELRRQPHAAGVVQRTGWCPAGERAAGRRCDNDKRDLLPGLPHVTAWACRNQRHGRGSCRPCRGQPAGQCPSATAAVARSIYSHLPRGDTPLWLGFKKVGNADPAAVLAVLA